MKYSKKKNAPKGQVDIAIPAFGYKSHIMTERAQGFIRSFTVADACRYDGAQLPNFIRWEFWPRRCGLTALTEGNGMIENSVTTDDPADVTNGTGIKPNSTRSPLTNAFLEVSN